MDARKTGFWSLFLLALLLNVTAQFTHEAGHWVVYQAYGRGPVWGFIALVQRWETSPLHPDEWQQTSGADGEPGWLRLESLPEGRLENALASGAGPVAGLLGVALGLALARWGKQPAFQKAGLMFALAGALAWTLYYLRSPWRSGGDEFDLAVQLGLAKSAVEIPFALAFIVCLVLGLKLLDGWQARLRWLGAAFLGGIPAGLLLVQADALVRAQVDAGNPLFQGLFGFSTPVLLLNALALLGVWMWWTRQNRKETS